MEDIEIKEQHCCCVAGYLVSPSITEQDCKKIYNIKCFFVQMFTIEMHATWTSNTEVRFSFIVSIFKHCRTEPLMLH